LSTAPQGKCLGGVEVTGELCDQIILPFLLLSLQLP